MVKVVWSNLHPLSVPKKQQLDTKLKISIGTFDDLKVVLSTISDISDMSLDVEIRLTDIEERYRTLAQHNVKVMSQMFICYLGNYCCRFVKLWISVF